MGESLHIKLYLQPLYLISLTATLHIRLSVLGMFSAPYVFPHEFISAKWCTDDKVV